MGQSQGEAAERWRTTVPWEGLQRLARHLRAAIPLAVEHTKKKEGQGALLPGTFNLQLILPLDYTVAEAN